MTEKNLNERIAYDNTKREATKKEYIAKDGSKISKAAGLNDTIGITCLEAKENGNNEFQIEGPEANIEKRLKEMGFEVDNATGTMILGAAPNDVRVTMLSKNMKRIERLDITGKVISTTDVEIEVVQPEKEKNEEKDQDR